MWVEKNNLRYVTALTGIPSQKQSTSFEYPKTLDNLLRGLRGSPFMYMVVAEAIPQTEVDGIIYNLRDMKGQVQSLTKLTLNETWTKKVAEKKKQTESQGKAETHSSREASENQLYLEVEKFPLMALAAIFMPAVLPTAATAILGAEAVKKLGTIFLTPEFKLGGSRQWTRETAVAKTTQISTSFSQATELSLSQARTLGREYINVHAQAATTHIEDYIERFRQGSTSGSWKVGVYFLAETDDVARRGATILKSTVSGEKSRFEPIRIHNLRPGKFSNALNALKNYNQPNIALVHHEDQLELPLNHPLGNDFNSLTTPLNTEELTSWLSLPTREVPGVRLMSTASFSPISPVVEPEKAIKLGHLLDAADSTPLNYDIPLKMLAQHTLVTGTAESENSLTCQKILSVLQQKTIPFLVIELVGEKYVEWAIERHISVYMPGVQTWRNKKLEDSLTLNPLDVVWLSEKTMPQVLSHIDRLKAILSSVFPMHYFLPILLEEALFDIYRINSQQIDWLADQLPPFKNLLLRPTLTQLLERIHSLLERKGYDKQIPAHLISALITRIQSLQRGWKKQLFDQPQSTSWEGIFDRPVVINLSRLVDDTDKILTVALLLQFLCEYRQTQQQELPIQQDSRNNDLHHLTFIEDAHGLLGKAVPDSLPQANSKAKVAEMFGSIFSEMRSYGQGLLIVEQMPTRLFPDFIKNTSLKIVHRLVAKDDVELMSNAMNLTAEQSSIINQLRPRQAIIHSEQEDMAAWINVIK